MRKYITLNTLNNLEKENKNFFDNNDEVIPFDNNP
jgi:hypothetical protein